MTKETKAALCRGCFLKLHRQQVMSRRRRTGVQAQRKGGGGGGECNSSEAAGESH